MDDANKKICFVKQMFFHAFILIAFDLVVFWFNTAILVDALSS